jgi:hypothetical protein
MRSRMVRLGAAMVVAAAVAAWMIPAWGQPGSNQGSAKASASENAALIKKLAAARVATAKYSTSLSRAKKDGYGIITQMIPDMGFHFMNPNITGFDIRKPQILVYEHTGDAWQLGALEWVFTEMPQTPPLPNATFGFFPAACHYKDGTFIPDEDQSTCPPKNGDSRFNFWHPDLFTMHVWIWYPNPAGLYSGTNPLVTPFNGG